MYKITHVYQLGFTSLLYKLFFELQIHFSLKNYAFLPIRQYLCMLDERRYLFPYYLPCTHAFLHLISTPLDLLICLMAFFFKYF